MENISFLDDKLTAHISKIVVLIRKIQGNIVFVRNFEKTKEGQIINLSAKDTTPNQIQGFEDKFRIKPSGFTARYREKWIVNESRICRLLSSALEIYLPINIGQTPQIKEIVALHCEPTYRENGRITYKTLPHLHFAPARDPLYKAHIALYPTLSNQIFASMDDYYLYFEEALKMIDAEVLKVLPFGYTF